MDWKTGLKLGLGIALATALLYYADIGKILGKLQSTNLYLYCLAAAVFLSTYAATSLRWRNLSGSIGYDLSFEESFRMIAVAYGFNRLFPGNSGDIIRSKIFQRYRGIDSHGSILGIVALERFLDLAGLLTVGVLAAGLVTWKLFSEARILLTGFAILIVGGGLILFLDRELLESVVKNIPLSFESFLGDFLSGYRSLDRKQLAENLVYSVYIWSAEALVFFILVLSINAELTLWTGALITSIMSLISSLPITPGGIGAVDAAGTGMLLASGISYSTALTLVILQRSLGFALVALMGVIIYWFEELSRNLY